MGDMLQESSEKYIEIKKDEQSLDNKDTVKYQRHTKKIHARKTKLKPVVGNKLETRQKNINQQTRIAKGRKEGLKMRDTGKTSSVFVETSKS